MYRYWLQNLICHVEEDFCIFVVLFPLQFLSFFARFIESCDLYTDVIIFELSHVKYAVLTLSGDDSSHGDLSHGYYKIKHSCIYSTKAVCGQHCRTYMKWHSTKYIFAHKLGLEKEDLCN